MERASRSRSLVDLSSSAEGTSHAPSTPVNHQSPLDLRTNSLKARKTSSMPVRLPPQDAVLSVIPHYWTTTVIVLKQEMQSETTARMQT
jgi:hypothetical protein